MLHSTIVPLIAVLCFLASSARADSYSEVPRVKAALEQGRAAEYGIGVRKNRLLALAFYCDAGTMGSPEGFFRVGRIFATGPRQLRNPALANAYLALAVRLGNQEALKYYDPLVVNAPLGDDCGLHASGREVERFDVDGYLTRVASSRRKIALLIRSVARQYEVSPRLALAIAMVESNLDTNAVSPRHAQGVMQLIPATQKRFGVTRPFDAKHNVRGALAYLRWLHRRFDGDWRLIVAAYNSGEGSIERHRGVPPFLETQQYVRRVLQLAGGAANAQATPIRLGLAGDGLLPQTSRLLATAPSFSGID